MTQPTQSQPDLLNLWESAGTLIILYCIILNWSNAPQLKNLRLTFNFKTKFILPNCLLGIIVEIYKEIDYISSGFSFIKIYIQVD